MSVHVSSWVWKHSSARGGAFTVHLYLADKADDDGITRFPRCVERMARECRMSERALQLNLKRLRESGEVRVAGKNESGTVIYQVVMGRGEKSAPETSTDVGGGSTVSGSSVDVVRDVLGAKSAGVQNLHPPEPGTSLRTRGDGKKVCTDCGTILPADATECGPCEAWK